ncbi:CHASE2 domain-containing protein [Methylobacterium planeticum]|uniref:Adenylate/guanylate cyclase domain-containing protein n=1 Tax=Methylobacterium planeticum TaxID=2615211 RepID=A0A6N6MP35_9HYPH|nr:adenylate/guanylate cyclase domain-containing protein [Methylobacterium planeticum]KAB1072676.1 adenylate/guanylate cyclase domain-containing protein [Methylobacterium planeticum]
MRFRSSRAGPRPARRRAARRTRIGLDRLLALTVLGLLLLLRLWDPAPVEILRLRTFDAFQVLQPRAPGPRPVVIVDIDEDSIRTHGQWPWARTRVADLVRRLAEAGAATIAFDVVFPEPDRLSPSLVAPSIPGLDAATRAALAALPSNDTILAEAVAGARVVLGQTALAQATDNDTALPETGFASLGPDPAPYLAHFPGLLRNLPVLEAAAAGRGLFTIVPERDGIVRRVPLVMVAESRMVPSLALEILRVLTGSGTIVVRSDAAGVNAVALPGFEVPTDAGGSIWLHFQHHDPARFVPAKSVLDGSLAPERFAGKIVLIGTSAIGLLDNKTTPVDRTMPGVEIQAQVLESVLTRATLSYPNSAIVIELGLAIAVSLGIIALAPVLGAGWLLLLGAVVAASIVAIAWFRFTELGILLDPTFPLAASLSVYAVLVFTNYTREQMGRQRIRSAFGQYLSPALVEQLAASPERLKLGGEERRLTIMFSDVRGFTGIAEFYRNDPPGLTALMNRFLTPLTDAIIERRGTIDKYMGDAIMAFWNAPLDDPDQEANACAAALAMLARMAALNARRREEAEAGGHPVLPIEIGLGINTGRCVVGNMGSDLRFDYSVLGDPVNLASRLEGQTKTYGVRIILGATAAAAVAERFALLELDRIRVKGKRDAEVISTLLGDDATRAAPDFRSLAEAHGAMLAAYRGRDWAGASECLDACRARAAGFDLAGLYDLYDERIARFTAAPPPDGWDGVHVAETK